MHSLSAFNEARNQIHNDLQVIERCFRTLGSLCHTSLVPQASTDTRRQWLPAIVLQSQNGNSLLPICPSSCSAHAEENTSLLPTFKIVEPPGLYPIPTTSSAPFPYSYRWILTVTLEVAFPTHGDNQTILHLSIEPHCVSIQETRICWITPSCTWITASTQQPSLIRLNAYTTQDLIHKTLSEFHLQLHLNVLRNDALLHRFTLAQPICVSLRSLLQKANSISQLIVSPVCPAIDPDVIYPHRHRWRIQRAVDATHILETDNTLTLLGTVFETKLYLPVSWLLQADKATQWHWVTAGPFEGLVLSVGPSEASTDDSLILQALSSSQSLLDLFGRALDDLDGLRFDYLDARMNSVSNTNTQPVDLTDSELSSLIDCLLAEIQCLTDQLETVIETTMRERIPPVSSVLQVSTGGSLDLAYRLTEWRDLVTQAHLLPVPRLDPSSTYKELSGQTDRTLERLCCKSASIRNGFVNA